MTACSFIFALSTEKVVVLLVSMLFLRETLSEDGVFLFKNPYK